MEGTKVHLQKMDLRQFFLKMMCHSMQELRPPETEFFDHFSSLKIFFSETMQQNLMKVRIIVFQSILHKMIIQNFTSVKKTWQSLLKIEHRGQNFLVLLIRLTCYFELTGSIETLFRWPIWDLFTSCSNSIDFWFHQETLCSKLNGDDKSLFWEAISC